jgi:hypothetical protein
MKQIVIAIAALSAAVSAFAQGTVNFSNRTGSIDAPVTYGSSTGQRVIGTGAEAVWGQLMASTPGGTLAAIGVPVPFREGAGAGYITGGGAITIPGVAAGSPASIQMVAWHQSLGATYAEALAKGLGGVGNSATIEVATGGVGTPPSLPSNLTGLTAFSVSAVVPEPSIAALGLLGAGLLLIRRKK